MADFVCIVARPLKAEQVKTLFAQGYSKARIAKEFGIGRTSVRRLLS